MLSLIAAVPSNYHEHREYLENVDNLVGASPYEGLPNSLQELQ